MTQTVPVNPGPPPDLGPLTTPGRDLHPSGRVRFTHTDGELPEAALAPPRRGPSDVTHVVLTRSSPTPLFEP